MQNSIETRGNFLHRAWAACGLNTPRVLKFTILTWTTMHLIYPQTFCITVVFDFTLDDCNTQEELETSALPFFLFFLFFWGGGGGGGGGN